MQLVFRMDMTELLRFNAHVEKELKQAIRSGVNSAAVIGKRAFIQAAVPDIGGNVTRADVRGQITDIRRAGEYNLTAFFTVRNKGFQRTPTIISLIRGNQHKPGGGTLQTFKLTGGGSNPLRSPRMFMMNARKGGRVVNIRDGRTGSKGYKTIRAEGPATAMAQPNAAPRIRFEVVTAAALQTEVSARVQAVLNGGSGSNGEASDT